MHVRILVTVAISFVFLSSAQCGEVSGRYASRLLAADIAQIKTAVTKERGIPHTIKKIEAVRADKVAVQTYSRSGVDEDTYYDFNVLHRAGAWLIDMNSIQVSIEQRDFRTNGPAFSR